MPSGRSAPGSSSWRRCRDLQAPAGTVLQVRIGIATGLVVVGDLLGSGAAQEQAVVGETPNLAARLQGLAEPDSVVIAAGTRRLVGDLFECVDLGGIAAKGFAEPVRAYRVLGIGAAASRFEAFHAAALAPLVGREEEIGLLRRRWEQAKGGKGGAVLLAGEAGVGKSRLLAAVQEALGDEPHGILRYFCSPHHQDSALHPVTTQLERAAGFARGDPPGTRLAKLEALLAPTKPPAEDVALLADLLSLPLDDRYPPSPLTPQRKRERTFEALLRQLEQLSAAGPVLMVFEDVHWIDPSSRELLDLAVERVARLPILLLITFRPEFEPSWTGRPHVTALSLSRLRPREAAALVRRVTGGAALPDARGGRDRRARGRRAALPRGADQGRARGRHGQGGRDPRREPARGADGAGHAPRLAHDAARPPGSSGQADGAGRGRDRSGLLP